MNHTSTGTEKSATVKVQAFFSAHRIKHFNKGEILLFPGDKVESVYFIEEGSVKQYSISSRGDEVIFNIFKPGAFFPMANIINDMPVKYMLEVETNANIRLAPKDEVLDFLKDNSDVLYDLLSRVYRGTEGLLGRLEQLMTSGAGSRLIYELIIEAKRFGEVNGSAITVNLNESSLAQRAGLSRETVNREIRKLKASNLVQVKRNNLIIPDLKELEKIIG